MLKQIRTSNSGFTLIEVLIVVAIIAIIVGIAVPALGNARTNARNTKIAAIQAQVATAKVRCLLDGGTLDAVESDEFAAIQSYLSVNGVMPSTDTDLLAGLGTGVTLSIGDSTTQPAVTGGY